MESTLDIGYLRHYATLVVVLILRLMRVACGKTLRPTDVNATFVHRPDSQPK